MDSDIGPLCPALFIGENEGDLGLSTFNRSIGAIVRFFCPQDDYRLFGPDVVECQLTTQWNDSIPKCFPSTGPLPTTSTEHMTTDWPSDQDDVNRVAVETVVIILWAGGGAILLTLIILLACILRNHKKHRRARNVLRGNHPQGGVNQGFTSYDEIWTWIPVVTDTQPTCTPPRSTSARESSPRNAETIATLTPPSYHDVMRESSNNTHIPSLNGQRAITRAANQDISTPARQPGTTTVNEYDTIPADGQRPVSRREPERQRISTAVVASTNQLQVHNRPGETTLSALTRALQSPRPGRSNNNNINNAQRAMGENSNRGARGVESNASQLRQCALNFYPQHTSTQRRQFAL